MNALTRRISAAAILVAAPTLIALGTATTGHADTAGTTTGSSFNSPAPHPAFPNQTNTPKPGTPEHHHHQRHHAG